MYQVVLDVMSGYTSTLSFTVTIMDNDWRDTELPVLENWEKSSLQASLNAEQKNTTYRDISVLVNLASHEIYRDILLDKYVRLSIVVGCPRVHTYKVQLTGSRRLLHGTPKTSNSLQLWPILFSTPETRAC